MNRQPSAEDADESSKKQTSSGTSNLGTSSGFMGAVTDEILLLKHYEPECRLGKKSAREHPKPISRTCCVPIFAMGMISYQQQ
jgi:hypothetical protein